MYSATVRVLLLFGRFCFWPSFATAEEEAISCNSSPDGTLLSSVIIQIITDSAPSDTQWTVNDAFTRDILFSGGPHTKALFEYKHEECVNRNGCYQFTISDVRGNGLDVRSDAYYKVFYDDILIFEGCGSFGFLDHSPLFGEGCVTAKPSLSTNPSKTPTTSPQPSRVVTEKPSASLKPSSQPTKSARPTMSLSSEPTAQSSSNPSFSPTKTFVPTQLPTGQPILSEFAKDVFDRRRFPSPLIESMDGSVPFQPLIDCENDWLGCIGFPKPGASRKPDWVGKLFQTHPECTMNKNGRNRKCHLNLPVAKLMVPSHLRPVISGYQEINKLILRSDSRNVWNVAAVDLDNDGLDDIIAANIVAPNQIYFNKGNNEFDDPIDLPGGSYWTVDIEVGDLDNDGFVDIVLTNEPGRPSFVVWNEGGREFSATVLPYDAAFDVSFWDFDGDGLLDIVVALTFSPNVILFNNGDRTFDTSTPLPPLDPYFSLQVECGDLNNDGAVDIVFANVKGGPNQLLLNNGDNTFEVTTLPSISGDTADIKLGDIDSNGYLDIVVANGAFLDNQPSQILWNHGNGTFIPQDLPGGAREDKSANIVDVDGDGKLDIIIANGQNPHIILFYNNNTNTFDTIELPYTGSRPIHSTTSDIDRNGMIDILFATLTDGVLILMNSVSIIHTDSLSGEDLLSANFPGTPQDTTAIVAGPVVRSDNYLNLVIGNFLQPNQLLQISNLGSSSHIIELPGGSLETSCIVLMYFNEDSEIDIFVGNIFGPNQILINMGGGEFELIEIPNTSTIHTFAAASADMDNDGLMDLVVGNLRSSNQMLLNNGDGTFASINLPGDILDETMGIAIADMDHDENIDIIVGNGYDEDQPNYLLMNQGNGTFVSEKLPGGSTRTFSIAIGSLHNTERLDIVVGNYGTKNYILHHTATVGYEVKYLPGDSFFTRSLALGDIDGDGDLDLVISNGHWTGGQSNKIILNLGNGTFRESIIPNTVADTRAVAICDLDQDGTLDVIFGNYGAANSYFYQQVCESGAQLHSQSWCFSCPSFMGHNTLFFGQRNFACLECMPDHMQSDSGEVCSKFLCPFGERKHGNDECSQCSAGTFYDSSVVREEDDPASWIAPHCVDCNKGEYSDWRLQTVDECFKCPAGTSQNNKGSTSCETCSPGTFQSLPGQATCELCKSGGYCNDADACGGGFTPCDPGTYNNKEGQDNRDACIACPIGTFSAKVGATDITNCAKCLPGSYSSRGGQTKCIRCKEGTFQPNEGSSQCLPCRAGTYSDVEGQTKCSQCPYRLSSTENSTTCEFCAEGFYLKDSSVDPAEIFKSPSVYCLDCPNNAKCPFNTTLQTLVIPPNYWRESLETSTLYACGNNACSGASSFGRSNETGTFCIAGHTGPLCQVCTSNSEYFSSSLGKCKDCPPLTRLLIPPGVIIGLFGALFISRLATNRFERYRKFLRKASDNLSAMGLQAKLKILITFYQIIKTLDDVYGVKLDEKVRGWISFVQKFQFGLSEIAAIPSTCIGSMRTRLILGSMWPLIFLCICIVSITCLIFFIMRKRMTTNENLTQFAWKWLLYITILILFLALPAIAVSIFEAKKCQPFASNDTLRQTASYLIADWSIRCEDQGGSLYNELQIIFWIMFSIWLVLIPLSLFGLLMRIRPSVESQQITALADACSFLWRDYKREYMYWEVISFIHRMFLTGLIMLVDTQEGSDKALRLMIAILACTIYLCMVLYACPYQRREDHNLALVSNVLLITCFLLGIPIQLCDKGDETCQDVFGLHLDSYRVSILAVILIISMLAVTFILIVVVGVTQKGGDSIIIKLNSTNERPVLDLPPNCSHHAFISHIWSSGQDKTHSLVEKLRKHVPGIKIWLDVESLTNMESLEASVGDSAVFILMYTDGYFMSKNCRREVYAAVRSRRPTIVLYEGDDNTIDKMKERCLANCSDEGLSGVDVLDYLMTETPLLWLGSSSRYFAIASVKELSLSILKKLPYYQRNTQNLSRGLRVREELQDVDLQIESILLFSAENSNAEQIANEIQEMTVQSMFENSQRPVSAQLRRSNIARRNIKVADIESYSSDGQYMEFAGEVFFLLYLDDKVFTDPVGILAYQVKNAIQSGMKIILVHETDLQRGGVSFDHFFAQTPRELLMSPFNLFGDIAVPLYTYREYRKVSLRLILSKMCDATKDSARKGLLRKMTNSIMKR